MESRPWVEGGTVAEVWVDTAVEAAHIVVVDRIVAWVASGIEAFLLLASAVRMVAEGDRLAAVRHREVDHRVGVAHKWAVA